MGGTHGGSGIGDIPTLPHASLPPPPRPGDRVTLVDDSNEDWWKVRGGRGGLGKGGGHAGAARSRCWFAAPVHGGAATGVVSPGGSQPPLGRAAGEGGRPAGLLPGQFRAARPSRRERLEELPGRAGRQGAGAHEPQGEPGRGGPAPLLPWGAPSWVRPQWDGARAVPYCPSICLSVLPDLRWRGQDPGPRPSDQREEAGAGPRRGADRDLRGSVRCPPPSTGVPIPAPPPPPDHRTSGSPIRVVLAPFTPPSHARGWPVPSVPILWGPARGTRLAGRGPGTWGWPPGWHCPQLGHPHGCS